MTEPYAAAREAASRLAELTGAQSHAAVVVLGSGWGPAADAFGEPLARLAMTDLPGFLPPTAEGHTGEVRSVGVDGHRVLLLLGRTHLYEGHGPDPVCHGVRTAAAAGARLAVLTNANGSLRPGPALGEVVLVRDHVNLAFGSPLVGPRFVDLTDAWSARLRAVALGLRPGLAEAVYALLPGPHYETRAEGEWLRRIGADVVGMSTVPEAIAAREWGLEVVGLSTVTAVPDAAGIDPAEVVRVAERSAADAGPLLVGLVREGLVREGVVA